MIRRPPRSTLSSSSAASDVYKRQEYIVKQGGVYASARVGDGNFNAGPVLVERLLGADRQRSPAPHSLESIQDDVNEDLFNLVDITDHTRQLGLVTLDDAYP